MKQTCAGCDNELEVKFALNMTNCTGLTLEVMVECLGCGFRNKLRKFLPKKKVDPEEARKMFEDKDKNYIG